MSESKNLQALKAAYQAWHDSKGHSKDTWLELMGDQVHIHSVGEQSPGLEFARDRFSKTEAVDYLLAVLKDWEMVYWSPDVFVEQGDRIAMFGRCAWSFRTTGKVADTDVSHLWRFVDGKIIELIEIFDSAKAVAATIPDS